MMKAAQLLLVVATALAAQTTAQNPTPTYFGCTQDAPDASYTYSRNVGEGYCITEANMKLRGGWSCPWGFMEVPYDECSAAHDDFKALAKSNNVDFKVPQKGHIIEDTIDDQGSDAKIPYCHVFTPMFSQTSASFIASSDAKTAPNYGFGVSDTFRHIVCKPAPPTPSPTPPPTPSPVSYDYGTMEPTPNPTETPCVPDFDEKEAINQVFQMYKRNAGKDAEKPWIMANKLLADLGLDNKEGHRKLKMLAARAVRALRKSQGWTPSK